MRVWLAALLGLWVLTLPYAAQAYSEAPELAALVKQGTLPPVAKRLPDKPEVIRPLDRVGVYGGVLRNALRGSGDSNAILRMVGTQGLVRWKMDFSGVQPNVAEHWSLSPDAREFSFTLRHGLKWSDGAPVTTDDVLFAANDLLANRQFFASPPWLYTNDGKPMNVEKVDDYTFKIRFAGAYRSFIEQLATPAGQHLVMYPKHYCQQFHPRYNPQVDELVKAARVKDWAALMRSKCGDTEVATRWDNPDKPTLDPWLIVEPYVAGAARVVLKRNPYFWQVDTAGNQLPYIDALRLAVMPDQESIMLAAINGQLDFQVRQINALQNRPLLVDNAQRGGYKVLALQDFNATATAIFINQSTKNAKLRELLRQKEFRVALSLAMDRHEINDQVFLGQCEPWQIGPARQSRFFNEKLALQYTRPDLRRANELLDRLGLAKRDGEGFRLYPSGGRVALTAIVSVANPVQLDVLDLIRKQWARAGLELVIASSERTLYYDRANNNDFDLSVDALAGGLDPTQSPRGFVAVHPQESRMSLLWAHWYDSNGKQGEEPPAAMKKRMELLDQWRDAHSDAEADALFRQILAIAADEFEVLGVVTPPRLAGIRSTRLANVFDKMPWGWTYPSPGPALVQQWFFAR